ncbi:MAG: oligosaccharide flippase family protein, partial [Sporomusaceae bacterium]|nr:oligosaccharide flippase family protein [Sporomusaceae bacterium]
MSKDTFLKGALILTFAGVLVKIIGSVNRILLSRLLGGEGIGLYQMAYPIYLLALSVSSAGIPVAISIIVAEKVALSDFRGANRVFRISLALLSVTGIIFTFLLYFGAEWLIEHQFVRDARAYYAIVALAPAILFVTILSSYRGYFQGLQMMTPTAVSQIFEQLFRVVTMIFLAYYLLPLGLEYAAAGASFGLVILVVLLFLRTLSATFVAGVTLPLSLASAFG